MAFKKEKGDRKKGLRKHSKRVSELKASLEGKNEIKQWW